MLYVASHCSQRGSRCELGCIRHCCPLLPSPWLQPGGPPAEFDYDTWLDSGDFTLFAGTQLASLAETADSGGVRWPNLSFYRSTACDCATLCRVQPSDMVRAAGCSPLNGVQAVAS